MKSILLLLAYLISDTNGQETCDKSRLILNQTHGFIMDGVANINYTQNTHCEWLIQAPKNDFITLKFHQMDTECGYDYVFVYDGNSMSEKLLASYSGKSLPSSPIIAESGFMLIIFFSDTNYVLTGFRAEFFVHSCPNNCSENGKCLENKCQCDQNWTGKTCSVPICPDECGNSTGKGYCQDGKCVCNSGFSGIDCSLDKNNFIGNTWHNLAIDGSTDFPGRTGHSSVYSEKEDVLYIFGGYDLNNISNDLILYNFTSSEWKILGFSNGPEALYGHKMVMLPSQDSFLLYGGQNSTIGSCSDKLWLFNLTSHQWSLKARKSLLNPPALSKHSLTLAKDSIYLFGGSFSNGTFSDLMFKLSAPHYENWTLIKPLKSTGNLHVTGHSVVYYEEINSLILFGGIRRDVARFSQLSSLTFLFNLEKQTWSQMKLPRRDKLHNPKIDYIPPERAFHSAHIMGNYMVIFGGFSHKHNEVESCYDENLYFFHLGCQSWVSRRILEHSPQGRSYPKKQGFFGHASSLRGNNILVISGGFHGTVSGDVLAYTLPYGLSLKRNDKVCSHYGSQISCSSNPECGWCPTDGICYLRTSTGSCASNLKTVKCPGICEGLPDCQSCALYSQENGKKQVSQVIEELNLDKCSWCSHLQECIPKHANPDICGIQNNGHVWWKTPQKIDDISSCQTLDFSPGITLLKYYNPPNFSYPDEVSISNVSQAIFQPVNPQGTLEINEYSDSNNFIVRFLGSIHVPEFNFDMTRPEQLQFCFDFASIQLWASRNDELDLIKNLTWPYSVMQEAFSHCQNQLTWPDQSPLSLLPGETYRIDLIAERNGKGMSKNVASKMSKMTLYRKGPLFGPKELTMDYLIPFRNGSCVKHDNCLACTSDSECLWCSETGNCLRKSDSTQSCPTYPKLSSSQCSNCSQHIHCKDCVSFTQDGVCEWLSDEARCVRRGRYNEAIKSLDQCPSSCQDRADCSTCIGQPGRCVWCAERQECFQFSIYTAQYIYGQCKAWIDKEMDVNKNLAEEQQCQTCSTRSNCSLCLQGLGCGWCYEKTNPTIGQCMSGGFESVNNCSGEWAYQSCPDIDECSLNLHDCHSDAKCSNILGSYKCQCNKGFIGDGHKVCERTCYEDCIHGKCSDGPDYKCICDLGWTGSDCSTDCGCHGHSKCKNGPGNCDLCLENTEGEFCQFCAEGSFGNATESSIGCQKCFCNGHQNLPAGICDKETGHCFCLDNTQGKECEKCKMGFYGDPRNGGHCYHQCQSKSIIENESSGYLGCSGDNKNCLWIIKAPRPDSLIELTWQVNFPDYQCQSTTNKVEVYDGLPTYLSRTKEKKSLGFFCLNDPSWKGKKLMAKSGTMTINYLCNQRGFNASFQVLSCPFDCPSPRVCNEMNQCVCQSNFAGENCREEKCPGACGAGYCNNKTNLCECTVGYTGDNCTEKSLGQLQESFLFNLNLLPESMRRYNKLLPRFGHSLNIDSQGTLWLFGGLATESVLNDIRAFDTKNGSWLPITVHISAETPQARYFHAAELVLAENLLYIHGGMNQTTIMEDFWKFDLLRKTWEKIPLDKPYLDDFAIFSLTGHTMTYNPLDGSLLIIGGFSESAGFNKEVLIKSKHSSSLKSWPTRGFSPLTGIYGHTTVYNSGTFYVYGGISYASTRVEVSNNLYVLHYPTRRWSTVPKNEGRTKPFPRALHSAVSTKSYMVIYGGLTNDEWKWRGPLSTLAIFVYSCGLWINLELRQAQNLQGAAMTLDEFGDDISKQELYILGGFKGYTRGNLQKLTLPTDFCNLFHDEAHKCKTSLGCAHCAVFDDVNRQNASFCYSNSLKKPQTCTSFQSGTLEFTNGVRCDLSQYQQLCEVHKSCGDCLSTYPDIQDEQELPLCVWCPNCSGPRGQCVPRGSTCPHSCNSLEVKIANQCTEMKCAASDCEKCHQLNLVTGQNCKWTRKRPGKAYGPIYDWACQSLNETMDQEDETCPKKCHEHKDCGSCLSSDGSEGGWSECFWSVDLQLCLSPSYAPLKCLGGLCGTLLSGSKDQCPSPCDMETKCKSCLEQTRCGWCSLESTALSGMGVCLQGTFEGPLNVAHCDLANYTNLPNQAFWSPTQENKFKSILSPILKTSWHFMTCPAENECLNNHHNCDKVTQICIDTDSGFKCQCNEGYEEVDSECRPICSQGCQHGDCVEPEKCLCHFSYIGQSCDIECECNGHSQCQSTTQTNKCLDCKNNTMGDQCQHCKPFFVGDPRDGGKCIPCLEFCNGNTELCFPSSLFANFSEDSRWPHFHIADSDLATFRNLVEKGPKNEAAVCANCQHMTTGNKCDHCKIGFFGGAANGEQFCQPCDCNGHGEICDEKNGGNCICQNNTMSDIDNCVRRSKNNCRIKQCSKCMEYYIGDPEKSRQCYRQMSVDNDYCLDPQTQSECNREPQLLMDGQAVFFVVLPKFMNVDIRIIIDITQGSTEVFMSPEPKMFVVNTNKTTWEHEVLLDPEFEIVTDDDLITDHVTFNKKLEAMEHFLRLSSGPMVGPKSQKVENVRIRRANVRTLLPQLASNRSKNQNGDDTFTLIEKRCDPNQLNTFVKMTQTSTILHVTELKNRLVISLPENVHELRTTRFFLLVKSNQPHGGSFGFLSFRQDQLHIDLFVFFSVFFSCFFLFLALCIVVWRVKSSFDVRRARERHAVELLNMAQRPFASFTVQFSNGNESKKNTPKIQKKKQKSFLQHSSEEAMNLLGSENSHLCLSPLAIEPLHQNQVAVKTILVQMPHKTLSFGCVLTPHNHSSND